MYACKYPYPPLVERKIAIVVAKYSSSCDQLSRHIPLCDIHTCIHTYMYINTYIPSHRYIHSYIHKLITGLRSYIDLRQVRNKVYLQTQSNSCMRMYDPFYTFTQSNSSQSCMYVCMYVCVSPSPLRSGLWRSPWGLSEAIQYSGVQTAYLSRSLPTHFGCDGFVFCLACVGLGLGLVAPRWSISTSPGTITLLLRECRLVSARAESCERIGCLLLPGLREYKGTAGGTNH